MPAPAIRCRGLVKRYDDVVAVDGLDLEVFRGECFGLLGPNGAGKTTTIEILEGLTEPDAGEVEVLGGRFRRDGHALRERLGISLQETQLADKLTVEETLLLFRSFYRKGRDPEELLATLSLGEKRNARVGKLSGGQRQRLAVACALAGEPDLLFLDEPTTGLDPQSRRDLWEQVERFQGGGGTVLLTTHYMDEAERLADHIHIIDRGRLIASGSPLELTRGGTHATIRLVVTRPFPPGSPDSLRASLGDATEVTQLDELSLLVTGPADASTLARVSRWCEANDVLPESLTLGQRNLEDVFLQLTGRDLTP